MSPEEMVRAWKDPEHQASGFHAHPAGEIALDPVGGSDQMGTVTVFCCTTDAVWCPFPPSPMTPILQ